MKTLKLVALRMPNAEVLKPVMLFGILLLAWPVVQDFILSRDETAGYIDPNIWVLVLIGMICFLAMLGLSWWLLQRFWLALELPAMGGMVLQFKSLELWQQLGFYYASFALLLLAGIGCLIAIC